MQHPFALPQETWEGLDRSCHQFPQDLQTREFISHEEAAFVGGGRFATTMACGEEGGSCSSPISGSFPIPGPGLPTAVVGEGGGVEPPTLTTLAIGEEGGAYFSPF